MGLTIEQISNQSLIAKSDRNNQAQSKPNHYNALVEYRGLDGSGKSNLVKIQNQGGLR